MKIYKYILSLLLIISMSCGGTVVAQDWTEPFNITNSEFIEYAPDITIDNDNLIHIVWSRNIENNLTQIFYTNSNDLGFSWSTPINISNNSELECGNPHILHDSQNNIFVSYEYNLGNPSQTKVYLRIFDGLYWNDSICVTDSMPGSDHSFIVIDNDDRLYVFWAYQDNKFYYKYSHNNIWNDIYCPYDTGGPYFINKCVADNDKNLHCVGSSFNSNINYENISYFYFNFNLSLWNIPDVLNDHVMYVGNDIDLDFEDKPNLVWRERTNSTPPYNDGTFYSKLNEDEWSYPELIVEDPWDQRILIDSETNKNIFNREKTPTGSQLIHYLHYGSAWEGIVVDTSIYLVTTPQIRERNSTLYLVYMKTHPSGESSDIWLTRSDIFTNIQSNSLSNNYFQDIITYPNPFIDEITFKYSIKIPGRMVIYISDLYGNYVKTLVDENKIQGNYEIKWNGKREDGTYLKSGLYLVRFQLDNHIITKTIEYM